MGREDRGINEKVKNGEKVREKEEKRWGRKVDREAKQRERNEEKGKEEKGRGRIGKEKEG